MRHLLPENTLDTIMDNLDTRKPVIQRVLEVLATEEVPIRLRNEVDAFGKVDVAADFGEANGSAGGVGLAGLQTSAEMITIIGRRVGIPQLPHLCLELGLLKQQCQIQRKGT
jgi:hypothetical protein